MNHHTRRQQLASCFQDENLDGLLISNPVNVTYLTGFSGDSSYLILSRGKSLLVSDGRYAEQIIEECPGLEVHIRPPEQRLQEAVVEVLTKLSIGSLGFESGSLSVAESEALKKQTPTIDWKGGTDRVEKLRVVKDEAEIGRIREAIGIAERAFAMFRVMLRPDDTERELSDALEMYVRRAGGTCSSFAAIVAVGDRSARPHARPTDRRINESELLLVDWGACERFYKSDLTRVLLTRKNLCFSRTLHKQREADKLEQVYGVVLEAQEQALRAIRPGAKASDVDAVARSVIADAGYGQCFTHGLGHGIGLQVHEAPAIRTNSPDVLQAGMVFTVEPGIYLPGWGGVRIEDDVRVTPDGVEVLTSLPRDWASIHLEA